METNNMENFSPEEKNIIEQEIIEILFESDSKENLDKLCKSILEKLDRENDFTDCKAIYKDNNLALVFKKKQEPEIVILSCIISPSRIDIVSTDSNL